MRLTEHVSLVGSGKNGLLLTHPLDCNVYLVDTGDGLLLIDAGVGLDTEAILREISNDGYDPHNIRWIALTHAHADHAEGIREIQQLSGALVLMDGHEAMVMSNQKLLDDTMLEYVKAGFYPADYRLHAVNCDRTLTDGEQFQLGNVSFSAIVAPGHTGGGLCLLTNLDGRQMLFCGDVVFFNGLINLISIFDVDLLKYKESILRLDQLKIDTLLPGHLQPVMREAWTSIRIAAEAFENFSVPRSLC